MGVRGLTAKQQRFAELLASGSTKVDAFRQAYPSGQRTKGTEWEGAKRVARHPAVVAEVQRLTLLRSPHDAAAQAEHIAARLLELTKSPEAAVALKAISQWAKMAEAGLLKPPVMDSHCAKVPAQRVDRDAIIADLRRLYREGLEAKAQQRKELVAATNGELMQEADGQGEDDAMSLDEPPPSSGLALQSLAESPTGAASEPIPPGVLIDASRESLEPGDYELEAIPGRFPVRFRRVPRQAKNRE